MGNESNLMIMKKKIRLLLLSEMEMILKPNNKGNMICRFQQEQEKKFYIYPLLCFSKCLAPIFSIHLFLSFSIYPGLIFPLYLVLNFSIYLVFNASFYLMLSFSIYLVLNFSIYSVFLYIQNSLSSIQFLYISTT